MVEIRESGKEATAVIETKNYEALKEVKNGGERWTSLVGI